MQHLLVRAQQKEKVTSLDLYVDASQTTTTGTNTSVVSGKLVDSTADFRSLKPHQVVVNTTDGTATVVDYAENRTTLVLKNHIFTATSKAYSIDDHTGSSSDKFKYPQSALEAMPSTIGIISRVYIADGTYNVMGTTDVICNRGDVTKAILYVNKSFTAGGRIDIIGNVSTPANVAFNGTTPSSNAGVFVQGSQKIEVEGIKVTNCVHGITAQEKSSVEVFDTITNSNTYGLSVFSQSVMDCFRVISGESGAGNSYGAYLEDSNCYIADSASGANSSSLRYNTTNNIYAVFSRLRALGNVTANVNLSNATGWGVIASRGSTVDFDYVTIDSSGAGGFQATYESNASLRDSVVSNNTTWGISADLNSYVNSRDMSGAGNDYGLVSELGSVVQKVGTQPTGVSGNELTATGGTII